jgi:ABC-type branched-subunit amino acid transport system substrate-binding protein
MPLIALFAPLAAALLLFAGCASSPFGIGVPPVLTGVNPAVGVGARNGIGLAAKEFATSGLIHGHRLEFIVRDDREDPGKALAVDEDLAERSAAVLVSHMTSGPGLEAIPWCNSKGLLLAEEASRRGHRRALAFYETANRAFEARGGAFVPANEG